MSDYVLREVGKSLDKPTRREVLDRHSHEPLLERMWELRKNISAYDATYMALAEVLDAPVLTCDRRLARVPKVNVKVRLVKQG